MLYQYCDIIITVNSSNLTNPDGLVDVIYSMHTFLYYSVLQHKVVLQKTYPHPASELDLLGLRVKYS